MRIDSHTHFVAASYVLDARRGQAIGGITVEEKDGREWIVHPEGFRYPLHPEYWDMASKLADMDRRGINVSVLSPAPTLYHYGLPAGPALEFCRQTNDALAQEVAQSSGRLYGMATLPMQEPSAAARELKRAVLERGLKAAHIGTTVNGTPIDDPRFEPVLATAEDLNVPVVMHPYRVGAWREQFAEFYMTNLVGYLVETTVAAGRLILSGTLDRHPQLSFALVHAGGFLPYQIGRMDHGFEVRSETRAKIDALPSSYLRRFYFDTITHASVPLKFLVEMAGHDRIMLGTDLPFDMSDGNFAEHLASLQAGDETLAAIGAGNAIRLFGLDSSTDEAA